MKLLNKISINISDDHDSIVKLTRLLLGGVLISKTSSNLAIIKIAPEILIHIYVKESAKNVGGLYDFTQDIDVEFKDAEELDVNEMYERFRNLLKD